MSEQTVLCQLMINKQFAMVSEISNGSKVELALAGRKQVISLIPFLNHIYQHILSYAKSSLVIKREKPTVCYAKGK